jgi:hypothetical protein
VHEINKALAVGAALPADDNCSTYSHVFFVDTQRSSRHIAYLRYATIFVSELDEAVTPVVRRYLISTELKQQRTVRGGCDRTGVICAVSRLVVVRPVGAVPVRCVYSRPGASPQADFFLPIAVGYSMWRGLGQAQACAPAVPSTAGSTAASR